MRVGETPAFPERAVGERRKCRRARLLAEVARRGGPRAEVLASEPVAVAFEGEDLGVVDEPVDHRGGDHVVAEDLAPFAERLVRCDDHRGVLVAGADELEHEVRGLRVERDVADFVDDQQRDQREALELGFELVLAFGLRQSGDPLGRGRELDALPSQAGADTQGDAEMRFAGAGRLGVALLMLWIRSRRGCGWSGRRARCATWSWTCSDGGPSTGRRWSGADWLTEAWARSRRGGPISRKSDRGLNRSV